ncbi:MAG: nicotinate phosphoribosyltransferase [Spirochaetaceae bacterium]|jgi:nicotinate phosphoribosyltransferase|nr:nicotinate phosphoribosyltransferase [Spirochaetaceae bacterium]
MKSIYENEKYCSALQTDFYELTMAQGYWKKGMKDERAIFEMFFRKHPFGSGFSIFAGLQTLLDELQKFSFSDDDIDYLRSLQFFNEEFLCYLKDFRFTGALYAMDEGSVVFPQEPLIRIDSTIIECQIIEALLLNIINFQSLIATKTARIWLASDKGAIMEFGLRRAQGPDGALSASRASFIGGAMGTSNVLAGKEFGIKVMGTMAHSWIMAFPSEEEAFRAYAELYPDHPVFLIDTYDTLKCGIGNAVKVGKEVVSRGGSFGVRLDSGDMHYLSVAVRKKLDEAGLTDATIAVSNDLDENVINALIEDGAPIDSWGVGTRMVTGGNEAAFTGVYKLAAHNSGGRLIPTIKFSDNPEKTTLPGVKQVWRLKDAAGLAVADIITLDEAEGGADEKIMKGERRAFWHTRADYRHFYHTVEQEPVPLLIKRLENGKQISPNLSLGDIQSRCKAELAGFDDSYKRLLNPHIYKVSITEKMRTLTLGLIKNYLGE